jgi:pimeloyl-ACP methyl ester carboxylesterase
MSLRLEVITRRPPSEPRPTPLLFVHGAWHGAWCWDVHFLPYFAQQGYVCHALSLRGHGGSQNNKSLRFTRIGDYVDDVAQVANTLERPPVVVGHSMGGFVVQKYLEKHDAPGGVLLASAPPTGTIPALLRYAGRHPLTLLKDTLTLSLRYSVATPELVRDAFFSAEMPPEKVRAYSERMQDDSFTVIAFDAAALHLVKPQQIKAPILVLGAERDTIFTNDEMEATARAYHTTAEILPNMAHDMMLEAGWQGVADRIVGWLGERGL